MSKIGRPTDYREAFCEQMIKFMALGHTYEAFDGFIGTSKQTLYTWEKKHPAFLDAKRIARGKCQVKLEQLGHDLITGKSKGNASVLIFFMKNMTSMRDDPVLDDDDGITELEFMDDGDESTDKPY